MATEPRLAAGFWVAALLRRLSQAAIPAYVTAHGDDTAGDVQVKAVAGRDVTVFTRQWDLASDRRGWVSEPLPSEAEADARMARARGRDPDLWLLEVEAQADTIAALLAEMG